MNRLTSIFALAFWALAVLCPRGELSAQSLGSASTIEGIVVDPSGAAVANATVEIQNPVSQYTRTTQTDGQGKFQFDNIPYNNYHLTATAPGFQMAMQDV